MTIPGVLNFWASKIPPGTPLRGVGKKQIGSNDSQINLHACQIWLQSDGRVEKKGGHIQTHKGILQLYIVEDKPNALLTPAKSNFGDWSQWAHTWDKFV